MNIGLIGYGKMGKEIEKILLERGHKIGAIINHFDEIEKLKQGIDVAIEFTQPDSVVENILWCISHQIPIVVGTTGWYNEFDLVVKTCKLKQGAIFYATNFSVGVNIAFKINEMLAKIMSTTEGYQTQLSEIHHIHKKDSPSGTAITLAEGVIANNRNYKQWIEVDSFDDAKENVLPIKAIRDNEVPGTHEIVYDSAIDKLIFRHEAKSRKGFALGSVLAAEFVVGKKGVFNMKDLLNFSE